MRVDEIMRTEVVTVAPDVPVTNAIDTILQRGVSELFVVDHDRRVVGVVTEADIVARVGFHLPDGEGAVELGASRGRWRLKAAAVTVDELMTEPAFTATRHDPVASATARMVSLALKRLPVVDDEGRLVGVISQRDVLRMLARRDAGHEQGEGTVARPANDPDEGCDGST